MKSFFIKTKDYAKSWRNFLLDLLLPIECLSCFKEGEWICEKCQETIPIKQTQECVLCGKNNLLGNFCQKCKPLFHLDGVLVASNYKNKLLSEAIKTLKYKLVKDLSKNLSKLLIELIATIIKDPEKNYFYHSSEIGIIKNFSDNIVIPVPLHKSRLRWRGFNQSEELAKIFANHFDLKINQRDLIRVDFKKPQTSLDKDKRIDNVKNCFSWIGNNINKKNILLIDDVSTSAATLNECAKVLKENGAKKVWGLVIAHG